MTFLEFKPSSNFELIQLTKEHHLTLTVVAFLQDIRRWDIHNLLQNKREGLLWSRRRDTKAGLKCHHHCCFARHCFLPSSEEETGKVLVATAELANRLKETRSTGNSTLFATPDSVGVRCQQYRLKTRKKQLVPCTHRVFSLDIHESRAAPLSEYGI